MTTTSIMLKGQAIVLFFTIILLSSCNKQNEFRKEKNESNQTSTYSSDVIEKWMTLQVRLMKNATGIPNHAFSRPYVYAGIAALESIAPGLPAHAQWTKKWNGLS